MTQFPEFITNRRRELELTLGDVAKQLGVSPITVSNWSTGEATPKPDSLVALAALLEVPADDLAAMAGVTLKTPERAVNLMPTPAAPPDEDVAQSTGENAGPLAMLRTATDEERTEAVEEPSTPLVAADEEIPADRPAQDDDPAALDQADSGAPAGAEPSEEAAAAITPDEMDSELAELIEEAASEERREPIPAVVTRLPGPDEAEPVERRRPTIRRRRTAAEQPAAALPLTYIEDPKQLTRYRIRWALTVVILVIMFFILLWASRELLSALSDVWQAVTPGGIGE
jgi:transcriptional regulator with XRE-family HTH domain